MRCNDRELLRLCDGKSTDMEGVLYHMRPSAGHWSDWYQQPQFKERYFKLIANLLFYYRVNSTGGEHEPLGILVLESAQIAYERSHHGIPFAFSIVFRAIDSKQGAGGDLGSNSEEKHVFACRCDEDVNRWVGELKKHSYEYWRSQYVILRTKISMKTGRDPILDYMKSKNSVLECVVPGGGQQIVEMKVKSSKKLSKKSTFHSHIETSTFFESSYETTATKTTKIVSNGGAVEGNLIDL